MYGERRVLRTRVSGAVAATAALAVIGWLVLSGGAAAPAGGTTTPPIHHIVVILQENHSFDNVLGQLCAKEKPATCKFATSGLNKKGETIPLSVAEDHVPGVAHGQEAQLTAMNKGKMNGFEQVGGCEEQAVLHRLRRRTRQEPVAGKWRAKARSATGSSRATSSPPGAGTSTSSRRRSTGSSATTPNSTTKGHEARGPAGAATPITTRSEWIRSRAAKSKWSRRASPTRKATAPTGKRRSPTCRPSPTGSKKQG